MIVNYLVQVGFECCYFFFNFYFNLDMEKIFLQILNFFRIGISVALKKYFIDQENLLGNREPHFINILIIAYSCLLPCMYLNGFELTAPSRWGTLPRMNVSNFCFC